MNCVFDVCDIIDMVGIGEKLVMWSGFYFLIVCEVEGDVFGCGV